MRTIVIRELWILPLLGKKGDRMQSPLQRPFQGVPLFRTMRTLVGRALWILTLLMLICFITGCNDDDDDNDDGSPGDDDDVSEDDDNDDNDTGDDDDDDDDNDDSELVLSVPAPGLEEATAIASLPILRYGSVIKQVSSHDKDGGNDDGFARGTQLYIDDKGEYVVFDDYGPGCIYRIWFTILRGWTARIKIYVDDMDFALVNESLVPFFSGTTIEPFVQPLIEFMLVSTGGFINYVPICYEQRAKVTWDKPTEFYNITYRRFDTDYMVDSFTGNEDYSLMKKQWTDRGADPKPAAPTRSETGSVSIAPSESATILSKDQAGAVWSLWLGIEPFEPEPVSDLWLVATWDGHKGAGIEAPLNEFFNSYQINRTRLGLLLGKKDDRYYCHLPMPYWTSARIVLENRGTAGAKVDYEIAVLDQAYPKEAGYFTTVYNTENPTAQGQDYTFAKVAGAGHYVGVTYTMTGALGGSYMEGDERFYVDGSSSPALYGTGTEDYFNGGWYFNLHPFGLPLHGAPFRLVPLDAHTSRTGAYRMHVADVVPFFMEANLGMEHDANNGDVNDDHSSVAYLYLRPEPLMEKCDELDIGDATSETGHNYSATQATPNGPMVSYFEGDHDDVEVAESGNEVAGSSEFTLSVNPDNNGVLLRRMLDQKYGRQLAEVYVDNQFAGTWYDVFENPILRWAHSDLPLPLSLTAGKSKITVRVENNGQVPWTEYSYEAFCYLPAELPAD